jgi:DNA polymerase I-like protein with 3'-5' exonuclease and polymerase domains
LAKIRPIVIDFETERILPRPLYPPKPVGVAIKCPGRKGKYFAWGHPTKNNSTFADAKRALQEAVSSGTPLLFHNGKFDVDVCEVHMGVQTLSAYDPTDLHDTAFLLFLLDPHAWSLALKPSATRLLGLPPDEQEAVRDWLIEHQSTLRSQGLLPADVRLTVKSEWGAWICLAPGDLVGRYAIGDVDRTEQLFDHCYPQVQERGMLEAYKREQRIMPIFLRNEREGMRCDLPALEHDLPLYEWAMTAAEHWLRKRLKSPHLDFNKDRQVAEALDVNGIVTEWTLTPTGLKSISKKVLKPHHYLDAKVFQVLQYRSKLETCISTYMKPWLETARATNGFVHAGWNQTRNDRDVGTRTGRPSGSPNFLAVAKSFEEKGDGWSHPEWFEDLYRLPLMRAYILPDAPSHWWVRRDYNQQELRILAHFEDGALMEAYNSNPYLDTHQFVRECVSDIVGWDVPRRVTKELNFGLIFGQGIGSTAEKLSESVESIQRLRAAQFQALPGLKDLKRDVENRGKQGEPVVTWGGRQYYCEEPRIIDGRYRTFEYKLVNYIIQGSAADQTKEAIIRWDSMKPEARFLVTVYDEVNISAHKKIHKREALKLREAMMSTEFDVPMLSDAEFGPNWAEMAELKEPKPI